LVYPLISLGSPGYWISQHPDEVNLYIDSVESRIKAIQHLRNSFDRLPSSQEELFT